MNGYFFLDYYVCSAIHVYTDRFTYVGIIIIRPPCLNQYINLFQGNY